MLLEEAEFAGVIKGALLDQYLLRGWYRMGFLIFTTHYISVTDDGKSHRVYWLRYRVPDVRQSKTIAALEAVNKHLSVACHPFKMTDEVDTLHKKYAANLKFNAATDLRQVLMDMDNEVYDSHIIEVRDNEKLVAGGIFDKGENSIAGIINFYDPEYRKQSLGKYVILQKYKYCLANNIPFYYPGYYMSDHPLFDYKLFLDKNATEVYLPEINQWVNYINVGNSLKSKDSTSDIGNM